VATLEGSKASLTSKLISESEENPPFGLLQGFRRVNVQGVHRDPKRSDRLQTNGVMNDREKNRWKIEGGKEEPYGSSTEPFTETCLEPEMDRIDWKLMIGDGGAKGKSRSWDLGSALCGRQRQGGLQPSSRTSQSDLGALILVIKPASMPLSTARAGWKSLEKASCASQGIVI